MWLGFDLWCTLGIIHLFLWQIDIKILENDWLYSAIIGASFNLLIFIGYKIDKKILKQQHEKILSIIKHRNRRNNSNHSSKNYSSNYIYTSHRHNHLDCMEIIL